MEGGSNLVSSDVYQDAGALYHELMVIVRMLRTLVAADLAPTGLTSRQLTVLEVLVDTRGITVNQLARSLGLAHSTVSETVDRLERRNLVERWADPEDRRRTWLDLTDDAWQILKRSESPQAYFPVARVLARATTEQREAVLGGVQLMGKLLRDQWLIDRSLGKWRPML